jgi:hypothetical protein
MMQKEVFEFLVLLFMTCGDKLTIYISSRFSYFTGFYKIEWIWTTKIHKTFRMLKVE